MTIEQVTHWIIDPPYPDRPCRCRAAKNHDNAGRPVDAEHTDPADPRALLDAYASQGAAWDIDGLKISHNVAAPAAFAALRKVLLMANVIRDGGPIDGANVAHEIDRLIISALEDAP